jgi:hypothetical protein
MNHALGRGIIAVIAIGFIGVAVGLTIKALRAPSSKKCACQNAKLSYRDHPFASLFARFKPLTEW